MRNANNKKKDDSTFSAYSQPEAYDIINSPGTAGEVDGLERMAARFVIGKMGKAGKVGKTERVATRGLAWLEPCSGSGRYLRLIGKRMKGMGGKRGSVVGVDFDPGMVAYAEAQGEKLGLGGCVRVVRGDIRRINERMLRGKGRAAGEKRAGKSARGDAKIDFAYCLHNSVRHLHAEKDLLAHLRAMRGVMSTRGVYAVGLELTPPEQVFTSEAVFKGRRGGLHVREVFSYMAPESLDGETWLESVHIYLEMESRRGGKVDRHEVNSTYHLRCWSVSKWREIVHLAGMEEVATVDSDGRDMPDGYSRYAIRVLRTRAGGDVNEVRGKKGGKTGVKARGEARRAGK